ncbi:MAG: NAD(+)/NADH kinase [bacterium]|nr:NAD(+)/NADH kinase [bacterium]
MQNIAIIPNTIKDIGLLATKRTVDYLFGKAHILMEKSFEVTKMNADYLPKEELFNRADKMVIIGGDGTILQEAADCARADIPVLGINLGKVGFLTEVEVDDVERALEKLLAGDYKLESRMLLRVELRRQGMTVFSHHALNDVVVSKPSGARLISMELYADKELMYKYTADGLIIATPTGSTGYSISAGGPVVAPDMELYVATPICAHMLSVRSAVLSADRPITIRMDDGYRGNEAVVTADGDVQGYINGGDEVVVLKSKYRFKLIKIGNKSFYDTLISKLS